MYNGIGLTTPRGWGTNGYIQGNKFFAKSKTNRVTDAARPFEAGQGTAGLSRLVILEDKLTEQGYTESEISDKLVEARKALEAQQEKDEEEGEVIPTRTHLKKVSDTQTHQVAARKEKQMETFRAALGIGLSESAAPPLMNNRKNNDDEKHKKKGEAVGDEIDESRHRKKKKEQKRYRHLDSYTGTDSSVEHSKKATRKKRSRKGYGSESDPDEFASGRKQKKSVKKPDRRRPLDSDDSDTDNDDTGKRDVHKNKSSHRRHDSDGGRENKIVEVQRRKIELTGSQRRGKDNMGSESDSDAYRAKDRKKETVKKGNHRLDSSEDDSDNDEQDISDADRARYRKKETVKKGRHRYDTEDDSESDIVSNEKVEKGRGRCKRRDSDDDEDSNSSYGRKSGKATAPREGTARRRSVSLTDDSDTSSSDDDSDSSDLKHQIIGKKNVVDKDRRGHRCDDGNRGVRGSHQSSQAGKGFASGAAQNDDRRRRTLNEDDRSERLHKSENNREMMKGKRKLDDEYHDEQTESNSRSRNLGREVEHKRDNPKDTKFDSESNARAYREKDDRRRDDYSRWEKDDQRRDDYSSWEKDDRRRDNYSRSVRSGGELDGNNGRQDVRIQSKISKPHYGSRRNDWDYEDQKGGRRHGRDEEEPRGREHERDEMDHKRRSHERDEEEHYRSHRQRKEEEYDRGNKGHVRDRQLDHSEKMAYDEARSSERKSRDD
ncbi:hypothetical protein CRYUN_Cryun05aG0110700 [Craigia yunnanensis]